jgi:hypothetical protein
MLSSAELSRTILMGRIRDDYQVIKITKKDGLAMPKVVGHLDTRSSIENTKNI